MKITEKTRGELARLFRRHGVETAYIFGSAVAGNTARESDIDVAVSFPRAFLKEKRFSARLSLAAALEKVFGKKVDVVVFNDARSLFFKYVIIKEGVLLFEKSEGLRVALEQKILTDYFDFEPFLTAYSRHYVESNL